jgi:hypothetical protein
LSPPSEIRITVRSPDGPRSLGVAGRPEVLGGLQQRAADRRPALALERLDLGLEPVAVQRADRRDEVRVLAALGARDAAELVAVHPQADLRALRHRVDELAERRLRGIEPRAAVTGVLVHRVRAVEDDQHRAVGRLLRHRRSDRR